MKRKRCDPRRDWESIVSSQGLTFHTPGGQRYWDETVCYEFTSREVDEIEAATNELQRLCLEAGQFIIDQNRWDDLKIPAAAIPLIKSAWEAEPPSIYGRFDLAYDGSRPPKLLEYNADTPTSLVEAAVIQWYWMQDVFPGADQFNSIHEKLIAQWGDIAPYLKGNPLYFSSADAPEDISTASYLQDTASQAGIVTRFIRIEDIGWNRSASEFRDLADARVDNIFALYPWEWLMGEYPDAIARVQGRSVWIEPIWKMMWSNKALLAILWEMFPGHPNLLEAHLDGARTMGEYCRKPILSREGANITLKTSAGITQTDGEYGEEGYVYQAAARIPYFDGYFPVIGSWIVTDHDACGMGIRESNTPITDNLSRFVPHTFA